MAERLQWIRMQPTTWVDWDPVRGGMEAHRQLQQRWPHAGSIVVEPPSARGTRADLRLRRSWWQTLRHGGTVPRFVDPDAVPPSDMVWANMALHMVSDPLALMTRWHRALVPQGYIMFSALGPDTVRELRQVWSHLGWTPPSHDFTDMHDWGDMLVQQGFAEPVMDVERIVLTFATARRALDELRALGRNLHPARFAGLRGRSWLRTLEAQWPLHAARDDGGVAVTFEIIYGHAFKAPARMPVRAETAVSLDDMRTRLRQGRSGPTREG